MNIPMFPEEASKPSALWLDAGPWTCSNSGGMVMAFLRWLTSREYRKAAELRAIVLKHFRHQRDVLPEKNRGLLTTGLADYDRTLKKPGVTGAEMRAAADQLETTANAWLLRYDHASFRENAESFLGTFALVFAVKSFFLSPMQIPTGSAQPTYYGITCEDLRDKPEVKFPHGIGGWLSKVWGGESWYELIAEEDCELVAAKPVGSTLPIPFPGFDQKMGVTVRFTDGREKTLVIPWAPEDPKHLMIIDPAIGKARKTQFKKGDPIVRCVTRSGDRIVVERVVYNFRQPERGEYFVFQSSGVGVQWGVTQGTHYIKRMVGGPGDRVRIGNDRFLYVNDRKIDAHDPGFEKVLGFDPTQPARDSIYSGYVNGVVFGQADLIALADHRPDGYSVEDWARDSRKYAESMAVGVGKFFPNENTVHEIAKHHYMGFGDNTMGSADSRSWGELPEEKVIGKSCFVMWPPCNWGFESGPRKKQF